MYLKISHKGGYITKNYPSEYAQGTLFHGTPCVSRLRLRVYFGYSRQFLGNLQSKIFKNGPGFTAFLEFL